MKKVRFSIVVLVMSCILSPLRTQAQGDLPPGFKSWWIASATARLSPKNGVRFSQLYALNTAPGKLQFLQTGLSGNYAFSKRWNLDFGYTHSLFRQSQGYKHFHRLLAEVDHKSRFGKVRMKNSLRGEFHFPKQKKFQYRFIFTNRVSLKTGLPGRMSPFVRTQLYYYLGGVPQNYEASEETEEGEEVDEEDFFEEEGFEAAPNGFHRFRISAGLRFRLTEGLYASVYYLMQREFNFGLLSGGELNYESPSGSTRLPFNHYHLVGVSLSYTFKLYK